MLRTNVPLIITVALLYLSQIKIEVDASVLFNPKDIRSWEEWKNISIPWFNEEWLAPKQVPQRKLFSHKCSCGVKNAVQDNHTSEQMLHAYPFAIWITAHRANRGYYIMCGGTIINSLLILTNAQCAEKMQFRLDNTYFRPELQRIDIWIEGAPLSKPVGLISINKVHFHPGYKTGKYDVALVELWRPMDLNGVSETSLRPVCIPAKTDKVPLTNGVKYGFLLHNIHRENVDEEYINHQGSRGLLLLMRECNLLSREKIHENLLCALPNTTLSHQHFGSMIYAFLQDDKIMQIGIWSSKYFGNSVNNASTVNLFIPIKDIVPFIEKISRQIGSRWCRHPKVNFADPKRDGEIANSSALFGKEADSKFRDIIPSYVSGVARTGSESGGVTAQFPWLVKIEIRTSEISTRLCGGAIINNVFILTAAHCFLNDEAVKANEEHPIYPVDSVTLTLLVYSTGDPKKAQVKVAEIIVHPAFLSKVDTGILDYDAALLKLDEPLEFWSDDGPIAIALPETNEDMKWIFSAAATIVGWEKINSANETLNPSDLESIEVPSRPLKDCKEISAKVITERMLCAGTFDPAYDTLQGNSGGPLFLLVKGSTNQFIQVGIISWGDLDFRKANHLDTSKAATLYTDVTSVLDFIYSNSFKHTAKWGQRNHIIDPQKGRQGSLGHGVSARTTVKICACGTQKIENQSQVVSGAEPNNLPWLVLISVFSSKGIKYCTGSVINDLFIITSAECLIGERTEKHKSPAVPVANVHVQRMITKRNSIDFQNGLQVESIHIHFSHMKENMKLSHNIALLQLKVNIKFEIHDEVLAPICLPTQESWDSILSSKEKLFYSGWEKELPKTDSESIFFNSRSSDETLQVKSMEECRNQNQLGLFLCVSEFKYPNESFGGPVAKISNTASGARHFQLGIVPMPSDLRNNMQSSKTENASSDTKNPKQSGSESDEEHGSENSQETEQVDSKNPKREIELPMQEEIETGSDVKELKKGIEGNEIDVEKLKSEDDRSRNFLRRKRREERKINIILTSIQQVLEFIESFASAAGANWCAEAIEKVEPPADNQSDLGI